MIKTYKISGMSCPGCKHQVEKILSEIKGIQKAVVSLENEEVTLETNHDMPFEKLKKQFEKNGGSYTISKP